MGNANGGGSGAFRSEHITSAEYVTRPLQTGGSGPFTHHGMVVHTAEGNDWLIHNPGSTGGSGITVVTPASNMSSAWHVDHNVPVHGDHTVQEVYNAASGRTLNGSVHYVTAGTCVGSAKGAEAALQK